MYFYLIKNYKQRRIRIRKSSINLSSNWMIFVVYSQANPTISLEKLTALVVIPTMEIRHARQNCRSFAWRTKNPSLDPTTIMGPSTVLPAMPSVTLNTTWLVRGNLCSNPSRQRNGLDKPFTGECHLPAILRHEFKDSRVSRWEEDVLHELGADENQQRLELEPSG